MLRLSQLIERIEQLPTSPQVLPKLQSLLKDPNSDLGDIVEVLRADSGLVAELIRLSNSALYARGDPVRSLEEAVNLLGFRQTYRATSLAIGKQGLAMELPLYQMSRRDSFLRSLAAAVLMEELAGESRMDGASAYTLGLLHGCGKLVVQSAWNLERYPLPAKPPTPAEERSRLDFHHAEATAALMQRWRFPEDLVRNMKMHLNPTDSYADLTMARLLHLAARAAPDLLHPEGPVVPAVSASVLREVRLEEGTWRDAILAAAEKTRAMVAAIGRVG